MPFIEIVEAEAQMSEAGQIQQKIVLKCFNWWILSNLLFFLCQEERNKYYYVVIVKDSYRLIYLANITTFPKLGICRWYHSRVWLSIMLKIDLKFYRCLTFDLILSSKIMMSD
jgi:hypothetical protein